jgi:hypothetical protein
VRVNEEARGCPILNVAPFATFSVGTLTRLGNEGLEWATIQLQYQRFPFFGIASHWLCLSGNLVLGHNTPF